MASLTWMSRKWRKAPPSTRRVGTVTLAPAPGWKVTTPGPVFEPSEPIVWFGYDPAATSTTCPGAAAWKARSKVLHGAAAVHGFESEPVVETRRFPPPPPLVTFTVH